MGNQVFFYEYDPTKKSHLIQEKMIYIYQSICFLTKTLKIFAKVKILSIFLMNQLKMAK